MWGLVIAGLMLAPAAGGNPNPQDSPPKPRGTMGARWLENNINYQSRVTLSVDAPDQPVVDLYRTPQYDWKHSSLESGRYPEEAFAADKGGRVQVRFAVDAKGNPGACTIIRSSGVPSLDAHACPHLMAHVHMFPALDARGAPTSGTATATLTYELRLYMESGGPISPPPGGKAPKPLAPITWATLEIDKSTPHGTAYGFRAEVLVGKDGVPIACNVAVPTQVDALDFQICSRMMQQRFAPGTDAAGAPAARVYSQYFAFTHLK